MQLTSEPVKVPNQNPEAGRDRASIRNSLSIATTALLAGTGLPGSQAMAAEGAGTDVGISNLRYAEYERVSVEKTMLKFERSLDEKNRLEATLIYDTMTGATPNGRVHIGDVDPSAVPVTTASGFSFTAGGATSDTSTRTSFTDFSDRRIALAATLQKQLKRLLSVTAGGAGSIESDYSSLGANLTAAMDLNQRRTTLTLGGGYNYDRISPEGGIKEGLSRVWCGPNTAVHPATLDCDNDPQLYHPANKTVLSLLGGMTQVLSRRTLLQVNYSYTDTAGYLSDPYKQFSVINGDIFNADGQIQEVGIFYEKRPRHRASQSVYTKLVIDAGRNSFHPSYRFFWDNWGIFSHTAELRNYFQLNSTTTVIAHMRYNQQHAADFYVDYFLHDDLAIERPDYASADHRLSRQDTYTVGLQLNYRVNESINIGTRAEAMYQSYLTTTIPDMPAGILQFLLKIKT